MKRRKPGAGRPPLAEPPTVIHLALRLYYDADTDLERWLSNIPARHRSAAVKAALRGGIGTVSPAVFSGPADEDLDAALDDMFL